MSIADLLLVIVALAVGVGAFSQSVTGIGFALVVVPACALALPGAQVVGTVAVLGAVMDAWVLGGAHRDVDGREVARLVLPGLCALPVGVVLIHAVPLRVIVVLGSVATLAATGAMAMRGRTQAARHAIVGGAGSSPSETSPGAPAGRSRGALGVGFASGVLGFTSGLSAPPLALHAMFSGRPLSASRGTMAAFFLVIDVLAALLHPHFVGAVPLVLLVAAGTIGVRFGVLARARLADATVRAAVLGLVVVCALGAMIHSLW